MRESAKYVDENLTGPLKVVEVGVGSGDNALDMLNNMDISMLYLVDPYVAYCDHDSCTPEDALTQTQDEQDAFYSEMVANIGSNPNVTIVKKSSVSAALDYSDGFFDYVYIDGCLSTQSVSNDISAWWPKVKEGGVLAGHDYDSYPGVRTSVDSFVSENELELHTAIAGGNVDWYIVK